MSSKRFQSGVWSVEIPEDWSAEPGDPIAVFRSKGVGALQISATRKSNGRISEQDLEEFLAQESGNRKKVTFGAFQGITIEQVESGTFMQKWWLMCDSLLLFLTYNCSEKDKGKENRAIEQIVKSLQVHQLPAAS